MYHSVPVPARSTLPVHARSRGQRFKQCLVWVCRHKTAMAKLDGMPDLMLSRLADFLGPEDTTRLAQTCRRFHSVLPRYLVMRGNDFNIDGPRGGHWAPEPYFDGPPLTSTVKKLTMSLTWKDQGWGNRKGEIFVKLLWSVKSGDFLGLQNTKKKKPRLN